MKNQSLNYPNQITGALRGGAGLGGMAIAISPLILLVPVALMGPNTILALYACATLSFGTALLWRSQEPPILLFVFLYQWLQAAIALFYGNIVGLSVAKFTEFPGRHEEAIFLLITGLVVLAVAMRAGAGQARDDLGGLIRSIVIGYPARTWVSIYIVTWLFSSAFEFASPMVGGLRQVFLIFAQLKWAAFLLLTASTFAVRGRSKIPWIIAFLIEISLGIGGFFAEFTSVFFYSLIGMTFSGASFLKRHKVIVGALIILMLFFAVAWTAVKRDYRDFLNQGTREQVVLVGFQDRMTDLAERVAGLDMQGMADGADKLVRRLTYFEFFGIVLQRHAMGQAHSGGEIWGWGAMSPLMPRVIFPDKPIVDDTALTMRFTGLNPAVWRKGTSVSLGYMTEAFIDFGRYGMFVAIASLGLLVGLIHRWLLHQKGSRILAGAALCPVALMPAQLLEISAVKLLPALALSVIASWVAVRFLAPILLRWAGVIRRNPYPAQADQGWAES